MGHGRGEAELRSDDAGRDLARGLINAIAGEVRFGAHDRMLYATDASLYQVEPLGVVIPASVEDALRAVSYCGSRGVVMLPRGGGTSLAGQCTNKAVVLDFSVHCRGVLGVDAPEKTCEVEPGITVDELNEHLRGAGLFFAPDPATSRHANVGGCIGNNAAGARSIRYGRTSESVLGLDVALADGARRWLDEGAATRDEAVLALTRRVARVVLGVEAEIRERFPKTIRRNAGYGLDMVLAGLDAGGATVWWRERGGVGDIPAELLARVNLAHLLCGSEGTLGVTLGARLWLHEVPRARGLAVVAYASLEAAIDAVPAILATNPTAVELLDDTVIMLAKGNAECRPLVEVIPNPASGDLRAVLYVEYSGADGNEIGAGFAALAGVCGDGVVRTHTDAKAMAGAWQLRKSGEPLLHGVAGKRKPITFVEDNAIPVERLGEFVREMKAIVARHGTWAAFYAHASVGVLHVRPLIDIHDEADRAAMRAIAVEAADLAQRLGGVMSGEHGDGRVRGPLLERFYGARLMRAFREVKGIFDPRNLLNPGNIVEPGPIESITLNLRVAPAGVSTPRVDEVETFFEYDGDGSHGGLAGEVELCNGAGVCRKKQGGTMCPSYMATLDERHSTRGRGNALRLAITGQFGDAQRWSDPETLATLDFCLSCKACKAECPSNVDVARLKAEYLGQYHQRHGTPLRTRLLGAVRMLNQAGAAWPAMANWFNTNRLTRRLVNRVLGVDARRSLPKFERSLARGWGKDPIEGPGEGPAVVLFGDCFTMFNEPEIGRATRRVLEAFGYRVLLADAGCCGRAKISMGMLAQAVDEIDATLERLVPLADRHDVHAILVAEPSCLSAMKDDWLTLKVRTSIEARRRVAAKAFLPEEFLETRWDAHPARALFRREQASVLLHAHCHQKSLWGVDSSAAMMRRVGDVRVLDSGCCGMAGSFGYAPHRFDLSMQIGERVLFPAVRGEPGARVVATGTSCRHQIHDATGARAMHPMEWLASCLDEANPSSK